MVEVVQGTSVHSSTVPAMVEVESGWIAVGVDYRGEESVFEGRNGKDWVGETHVTGA